MLQYRRFNCRIPVCIISIILGTVIDHRVKARIVQSIINYNIKYLITYVIFYYYKKKKNMYN